MSEVAVHISNHTVHKGDRGLIVVGVSSHLGDLSSHSSLGAPLQSIVFLPGERLWPDNMLKVASCSGGRMNSEITRCPETLPGPTWTDGRTDALDAELMAERREAQSKRSITETYCHINLAITVPVNASRFRPGRCGPAGCGTDGRAAGGEAQALRQARGL